MSRALVDELSKFPVIVRGISRDPELFSNFDKDAPIISASLRKYDGQELHEEVVDLQLADIASCMLRDESLDAYNEDRPVNGVVWSFASALSDASRWDFIADHVYQSYRPRVIPTADRRLALAAECTANAIGIEAHWDLDYTLDWLKKSPYNSRETMRNVSRRMTAGFRALDVVEVFGSGVEPSVLDVMARHFSGNGVYLSDDEDFNVTVARMRLSGFLDHPGEPDFIPPVVPSDWDEQFLLSEEVIELAQTYRRWKRKNPESEDFEFEVPEDFDHEEMLHLREMGILDVLVRKDIAWDDASLSTRIVWRLAHQGPAILRKALRHHKQSSEEAVVPRF